MTKTAMIRARVEGSLKKDVENILTVLGISPSEAINLYYKQIKLRKGIPFTVRIPNKLTKKTFEDTDVGKNLKKFGKKEDMFWKLDL